MAESMDKKTSQLIEELGLETDEEEGGFTFKEMSAYKKETLRR